MHSSGLQLNISDTEMSYFAPLTKLYSEIQSCNICREMDPLKATRRTEAIDPNMDVFIVSEALAPDQLRKSGVNFFNEGGVLGNTGKNLEKFLNRFGRTVFPQTKVFLSSGLVLEANTAYRSVYNTELTQCFPGRIRKAGKWVIRHPSPKEVVACIGQNFIVREVAIIKPKLLLLMGDESRRAFYKFFTDEPRKVTLQAHLNSIVDSGSIPVHTIGEISVSVLPIQHASGANPSFVGMLTNDPLVELIKSVLEHP